MDIMSGGLRARLIVWFAFAALVAGGVGSLVGYAAASIRNVEQDVSIGDHLPSLPSDILDRNGKLITQFFTDEKRVIVPIEQMPKHLLYAVLTKEDRTFFKHFGISIRGLVRAGWNNLLKTYPSGGSTITQVLARNLYLPDIRSERTLSRKLKEMWWALLLEKHRSKHEILQAYLDTSPFGHDTFGVDAASRFFFDHAVSEITVAEAAILVVQLSNVDINSPINSPNRSRIIATQILGEMAEIGYSTSEEIENSLSTYLGNFDTTRSDITSAYSEREDKVPIFSDYVRREFENLFYGKPNLYRDGFTINTSLDLAYQRAADEEFSRGIRSAQAQYRAMEESAKRHVESRLVPAIDALSLIFGIADSPMQSDLIRQEAIEYFDSALNPILSMISLKTGDTRLGEFAARVDDDGRSRDEKSILVGSLVLVDNRSGEILAMVGKTTDGSEIGAFGGRPADDARSTGRLLLPFPVALAIDAGLITAASRLYDAPAAFELSDGTVMYAKRDVNGWRGPTTVRGTISESLAAPVMVLTAELGVDEVGSALRKVIGNGVLAEEMILGLQDVPLTTLQAAQAFALFGNRGSAIRPYSIKNVTDRNSDIVLEQEARRLRTVVQDEPVVSEEAAYIMTELLKYVSEGGESANHSPGRTFHIAVRPRNSEDKGTSWAVAVSPYYTAAGWMGFASSGNKLGSDLSAEYSIGPILRQFMDTIHADLPPRQFPHREGALISGQVCSVTGLLPTPECDEGIISEVFIKGTEPQSFCTLHIKRDIRWNESVRKLANRMILSPFTGSYPAEPGESEYSDAEGNPILD